MTVCIAGGIAAIGFIFKKGKSMAIFCGHIDEYDGRGV